MYHIPSLDNRHYQRLIIQGVFLNSGGVGWVYA